MVVLDVDGVLTDGVIRVGADGEEIKSFHAHDGAGIKYLIRAGIPVAILSGRRAKAVARRARELGIKPVLQGYKFKIDGLKKLTQATGIAANAMCYVGDDLPDIPVMRAVGLGVGVSDARPEVLRAADYVTLACGGRGAVRELAEKILKAQKKWGRIVARYGLKGAGSAAGGAL